MNPNDTISNAIDLMADGENDQAEDLLNDCIAYIKEQIKSKADSMHYYHWGMCLYILDEFEQAMLKFEKAIEMNPALEDAYWRITSILFYNLQNPESAKTILEQRLLEMNPKNEMYLECFRDIQSVLSRRKENPEIENDNAEI